MTVLENVAYGLRAAARRRRRATRLGVEEALELVQMRGFANAPAARSSPAGSSSESRSRALWSRARACCCSTSRSGRSTSSCARRCRSSSSACRRQLGITFVYVTHDQEEAMSMSDRIAVMSRRAHRAARPAARDLRPARERLRGRVHRRHELPRWGDRGGRRGQLGGSGRAHDRARARQRASRRRRCIGVRPENVVIEAGSARRPRATALWGR